MPSPLNYYTIASADSHLPAIVMSLLSDPVMSLLGNPGWRGSVRFYITARTKVAAAAIAKDAFGKSYSYKPAQFRVVSKPDDLDDLAAALAAGFGRNEGDVLASLRPGRKLALRRAKTIRLTDPHFEIVAHWREIESGMVDLIPVNRDPILLPTRAVPAAMPDEIDERVGGCRGRRSSYIGGVATFADTNEIWVAGIGYLNRNEVIKLLSGLAGALTELEARS